MAEMADRIGLCQKRLHSGLMPEAEPDQVLAWALVAWALPKVVLHSKQLAGGYIEK